MISIFFIKAFKFFRYGFLTNKFCSFTASEFQLELEPASEESFDMWEGKTLSVRAPNMEQKCVWKSLMEHRIASQKTLQELAPAICHARSFIDACDYM